MKGRTSIPTWLWIVALGLIGVRIAALVMTTSSGRPLTGDEPFYDGLARNLIAGHGYTHHGQPSALRPPGWPLVLAALYRFWSTDPRLLVIGQGVFDAGTACLWGWIALRIYGSRVGLLTAAAVLLWPPYFRESQFLQTDPLHNLLFSASIALFAGFSARPGWWRALGVGLVVGAAALVRPVAILGLGGLALAWALVRGRASIPHWFKLSATLLGILLVLSPWTIRNAVVFHEFIPLSLGAGDQFLVGTLPETEGRWSMQVWKERRQEVLRQERERLGRSPTVRELDRALFRAGLENWKTAPVRNFTISLKRLWRLWLVPVSSADRTWLRLAFLIVLLILYAAALPSALEWWRGESDRSSRLAGMLFLMAVFYGLASSVFYTNSRYFEPVRPVFIMLAANTLARLFGRRTSSESDRGTAS